MFDLHGWSVFFTTAASAAATLAGLVIVAVSVNLQRIIAHRQLPSRAASTVASLALILVTSMAALIPQPPASFIAESVLFTILVWLMHLWSAFQSVRGWREQKRPFHEAAYSIIIGQIKMLPFVVADILLLTGAWPQGLYWLAAGVITAFGLSLVNTWVLLVEILR